MFDQVQTRESQRDLPKPYFFYLFVSNRDIKCFPIHVCRLNGGGTEPFSPTGIHMGEHVIDGADRDKDMISIDVCPLSIFKP